MRIAIGSLNIPKFEAFQAAMRHHPRYAKAEVYRVQTESGVGDQPLSLATGLEGAANRAKSARVDGKCDLGVGIESTLMPMPYSGSGWGDVTTCVLDDGTRTYAGISPAFEIPADVMRHILKDSKNLSQAAQLAGYTKEKYLGGKEGIIGVLTGGRITRAMYMEHAIDMALMHLVRAWE